MRSETLTGKQGNTFSNLWKSLKKRQAKLAESKKSIFESQINPYDTAHVFREADLAPMLEEILRTWEPPETMEPIRRVEVIAQVQENRKRLESLPSPRSFADLLALTLSVDQIEAVQEHAFAVSALSNSTLLMDLQCARKMVEREHMIVGFSHQAALTLDVGMRIMNITIPDPSIDEIRLEVWIYSGVDVDILLDFLQVDQMINATERNNIKKRWLQDDKLIGNTPEELNCLEKCFQVEIKNSIDCKVRSSLYNIGPITKKLWRTSFQTITISKSFKLSGYPFDKQFITFHLAASPFAFGDLTHKLMLPSSESKNSLNVFRAKPPRGFYIDWYSPEFESLAEMDAIDQQIDSILRFSILLRRNKNTFVWRTLLPSFMVVLIATAATTLSIQYQIHIETSMSVIPGAMMACAALQLTAAQIVPPHSGRTFEDILFFIYYIHLFLLYIALQFTPALYSYYVLWVALVILGISGILYFWAAFRPMRKGN